jgi:hypothetical protein
MKNTFAKSTATPPIPARAAIVLLASFSAVTRDALARLSRALARDFDEELQELAALVRREPRKSGFLEAFERALDRSLATRVDARWFDAKRARVVFIRSAPYEPGFFHAIDRARERAAAQEKLALQLADFHRSFEPEQKKNVRLLCGETVRAKQVVAVAIHAAKRAHERIAERICEPIILHAR